MLPNPALEGGLPASQSVAPGVSEDDVGRIRTLRLEDGPQPSALSRVGHEREY